MSAYDQYEVGYQACQYKNATWGQLRDQDYDHFKELLSLHVAKDSATFASLSPTLKPEDLADAESAIRYVDREDFITENKERYLDMTATERGGRAVTWRELLEKDYNSFKWRIGRMGKDTRSYKVLSTLLKTNGGSIHQPAAQPALVRN